MDKLTARDLLKFQIRRNITNLTKNFLVSLEEICAQGYDYKRYRKNALDSSNDRIRELEEFIDKLGENI